MSNKKQTGGQNISSGCDHQPDAPSSQGPKGSEKIYHDNGSHGIGGESDRSRKDDDDAPWLIET